MAEEQQPAGTRTSEKPLKTPDSTDKSSESEEEESGELPPPESDAIEPEYPGAFFSEFEVKESARSKQFFIAGRGGETNFHPGNHAIRPMILRHVPDYQQAPPSRRGKSFARVLLQRPEFQPLYFVVRKSYFDKNRNSQRISKDRIESVLSEHGAETLSKLPEMVYITIGYVWTVGIVQDLLREAARKERSAMEHQALAVATGGTVQAPRPAMQQQQFQGASVANDSLVTLQKQQEQRWRDVLMPAINQTSPLQHPHPPPEPTIKRNDAPKEASAVAKSAVALELSLLSVSPLEKDLSARTSAAAAAAAHPQTTQDSGQHAPLDADSPPRSKKARLLSRQQEGDSRHYYNQPATAVTMTKKAPPAQHRSEQSSPASDQSVDPTTAAANEDAEGLTHSKEK